MRLFLSLLFFNQRQQRYDNKHSHHTLCCQSVCGQIPGDCQEDKTSVRYAMRAKVRSHKACRVCGSTLLHSAVFTAGFVAWINFKYTPCTCAAALLRLSSHSQLCVLQTAGAQHVEMFEVVPPVHVKG